MKGRMIALDHYRGQEAAALIEDGLLQDFLIASDKPAIGTIYRAVPRRLLKGQGGAFLDTPDGPAFLRQTKGIATGKPLLVQVTGYSEAGKAIPVSTRLMIKSRYAIATPGAPGMNLSRNVRDDEERVRIMDAAPATRPDNLGLILRSACEGADDADIHEDAQQILQCADALQHETGGDIETLLDGDGPHLLAWREWSTGADHDPDAGSFERHDLLDRIEGLHAPRHDLASGAYLLIEHTSALVAVDVNTGQDASLAAGLRANIATARDLPRALRLRGLGGQITLDLAPMPKKERRGFESALKAGLRRDTEDTVLAGWTPLGHFELQRHRGRVPLHEVFA